MICHTDSVSPLNTDFSLYSAWFPFPILHISALFSAYQMFQVLLQFVPEGVFKKHTEQGNSWVWISLKASGTVKHRKASLSYKLKHKKTKTLPAVVWLYCMRLKMLNWKKHCIFFILVHGCSDKASRVFQWSCCALTHRQSGNSEGKHDIKADQLSSKDKNPDLYRQHIDCVSQIRYSFELQ